ncbi:MULTISPECIES: iron hydrogenase small subunit [Thermodesulfovibrio]|jgi:ferredoxin hydrogenase small subunit|uniref:Periplasmic Fe hydrogenase, small subunit n=1 Tax=Thermodesulfovibrio yellowstonii (strain ATCC 51303 / DSM 11347 / YP87) TaxID=289376 RepID=B5YH26_THEYD|nr:MULTISPECIES: iron hydrogenase small subunit [Thermodesulfovibrio]ACI21316.1 periplasmic Fe hydrogenase, small subunit [Thermodesulfovibrio yellowstonii DSM 11347]MBC7189683.1 iron hydrogenase small subunit [Candidatus Aerophobetes bacterium]MDI6865012.1 iron hydrogenase small subunit [Thermodesulfovibrio yellowstonii]
MKIRKLTRRSFLKLAGAGIISLSFTKPSFAGDTAEKNFFETKVGKERLKLIKARQSGQYKDDVISREKFKMAASHENPMIKRFYSEFAHHPLSEVSEALLHTHYKARV